MKERTLALCTILLLISCSQKNDPSEEQANKLAPPSFSELGYMVGSSSDNSCDCIEKQKCLAEVILEQTPGRWETKNEKCDWIIEGKTINCSYEERFVEIYEYDLEKEYPSDWVKYELRAKQIDNVGGTRRWCLI